MCDPVISHLSRSVAFFHIRFAGLGSVSLAARISVRAILPIFNIELKKGFSICLMAGSSTSGLWAHTSTFATNKSGGVRG